MCSVTGRFLHDRETLVQAVTELGAGYWVLTPLRAATARWSWSTAASCRPSGATALDAPARRSATARSTVTGLLRITEPKGGFLRDNDPAAQPLVFARRRRDRRRARPRADVAPYFIDADAAPAIRRRPRRRRPDGDRFPQQPPGLRADLVCAGVDAGRRLVRSRRAFAQALRPRRPAPDAPPATGSDAGTTSNRPGDANIRS